MILVSSCLLGLNCRYDGNQKPNDDVINFLKDKNFIAVCPEQMGGLATPRTPCEIVSLKPLKIMSSNQVDYTASYVRGVEEVLKLMELSRIELAILKAKSPSCGSQQIYDGSFSRRLIPGQGLLTQALENKNIKVCHEKNFKSR